jgi:hypothetical protein
LTASFTNDLRSTSTKIFPPSSKSLAAAAAPSSFDGSILTVILPVTYTEKDVFVIVALWLCSYMIYENNNNNNKTSCSVKSSGMIAGSLKRVS